MNFRSISYKEFWIHVIAWVCLLSFPISYSYTQFGELDLHMLSRFFLNGLVFYLNYLVLVPQLLLKKKMIQYIGLSILLLFAMNIIVMNLPSSADFDAINKAMRQQRIPKQMRQFRYVIPTMISFAFFLFGGTIALVKDFYKRDKMVKQKEIQKTETELRLLKNQLNPHFLFNSLNSIYSLVRNKSSEAPEAVITLSELMRYMLYEAREEKVPLTKEINYIKNYISLQRLRLSNSEHVTLAIKGDYEDRKIYPLLLISFIENAFKYGTDFKGVTDIAISIEIVHSKLIFRVNNFLGNYKKDEKSSGIGLTNIRSRLELLYPNAHSLSISKDEKRYFVDLELILS
ncbi:histidine kinase [Aureisphaera galaxeae]|uniref:sensor histidine kinase n=1 Tax=Aureisphaera galaxeae TaxID=1538023 RepID=UPI0023503C0B|nr:histidine kinase [Aureisphaera galaxeae]MDC8004824.1 histidine kinase [Aureisphaera galaxeae]